MVIKCDENIKKHAEMNESLRVYYLFNKYIYCTSSSNGSNVGAHSIKCSDTCSESSG